MTVLDTIRIKRHHDHDIDTEQFSYHEWIEDGREMLDSMGRRNAQLRVGGARWSRWTCNNTECNAYAIIHDDAVRQLLEADEARWVR